MSSLGLGRNHTLESYIITIITIRQSDIVKFKKSCFFCYNFYFLKKYLFSLEENSQKGLLSCFWLFWINFNRTYRQCYPEKSVGCNYVSAAFKSSFLRKKGLLLHLTKNKLFKRN